MMHELPSRDARAEEAAGAVSGRFGTRLYGIPGTHLLHTWQPPQHHGLMISYKYWWHAHYLDCLVDAGWRALRGDRRDEAGQQIDTAHLLLRALWLRSGFRYRVPYYDDMAWLGLAVHRLDALSVAVRGERSEPALAAGRELIPQLRSACTPELGGGTYWHTDRDFKNAPATGPTTIFFHRIGDHDLAGELIDWVYDTLMSPQGLVWDGLRVTPEGNRLVEWTFTYNQGTVLGALLALGDDRSLARAEALIDATYQYLRAEELPEGVVLPVLRTHGGEDGGLFTAILLRYLALAAADVRLDDRAREQARSMLMATADALWDGSSTQIPGRMGHRVFSPVAASPAADVLKPGAPLELAPQLQAWMGLEAAAWLEATDAPTAP